MANYIGAHPVVGMLILLILLYVLLRLNNIDIAEFFASGGFARIYNDNPLIVVVTMAVIVYVSYVIYRTLSNKYGEGFTSETPSLISIQNTVNNTTKPTMSFDRFYQTFVMVKTVQMVPDNSSESESYYGSENKSINKIEQITYSIPNNKVMILRTNINGIKYYLVMDSMLEKNLPYRQTNIFQGIENADKAAICKIGGLNDRYVCPVLLREDLLDQEYKTFITKAFSDVAQAVNVKKALDNYTKQQEQEQILKQSLKLSTNSSQNITDSKTDAQKVLQQDVLPRYIHHLNMIRQIPVIQPLTLSDVIVAESQYKHHLNQSEQLEQLDQLEQSEQVRPQGKYCYTVGGYLKEQTSDITKLNTESPYMINLSRSFSPYTALRQEEIIGPNNSKKMIDIVNDKKFACATQTIDVLKYSEFFASTVTPSIDNTDNTIIPTKPIMTENTKPQINNTFILTGKNNSNIVQLNPVVNFYALCDFKNANQVAFNNVKCWMARLDSYTDPSLSTLPGVVSSDPYNDKSSPYYMKPRIYNIGIIPDDYKQCNTLPDGTIDTFCRGNKYINDVDYSDARKIDFEVITVQLNPI